MSDNEHLDMIADCERLESKLTEWEATFIDSLPKCIEKWGRLTENQSDKLEAIWERITA